VRFYSLCDVTLHGGVKPRQLWRMCRVSSSSLITQLPALDLEGCDGEVLLTCSAASCHVMRVS
jgi:hypothetical protein